MQRQRRVDLIGKVFSHLTVVSVCETDDRFYNCVCSCGNVKRSFFVHLTMGKAISCGCVKKPGPAKHRKIFTKAWYAWSAMKQRCLNPNHKYYHRYGGRGITICDRWHDFVNFLDDMGEPEDDLTLERIDNDDGYHPGNCEWMPWEHQHNNKEKSIIISYDGRAQTISQWARETGLNKSMLARRYHAGLSAEEILTKPSKKAKKI